MKIKISILLLIPLLLFACKKDDPCETQCLTGETIVDCICVCPEGSEGENCETLWRDKVLGTWNVISECVGGGPALDFVVELIADSSDEMKVNMVWGDGEVNTFFMSSSTQIDMPAHMACSTCFEVEGSGEYKEDGTIEISFSNTATTCEWTMTK